MFFAYVCIYILLISVVFALFVKKLIREETRSRIARFALFLCVVAYEKLKIKTIHLS